MLDNIEHIKAYWIMMGLQLAQVALHFGADDIQGTVVRETIFHAAGAVTGTERKIEELVRVVRDAGRIPVQRDTYYNELRRWDEARHCPLPAVAAAIASLRRTWRPSSTGSTPTSRRSPAFPPS